jgi:hypothetical protein
MELDTNKIDDAVLALLFLGLHEGDRVWKGFDWESMNRLPNKATSAIDEAKRSSWF